MSAATSVRVSDDLVGWVKRCDGGVKEEERRRPFLSEETVEVRSSDGGPPFGMRKPAEPLRWAASRSTPTYMTVV